MPRADTVPLSMGRRYVCAAICMTGLAMVELCGIPAGALATGLCWRSLAPDTGSQDMALGMTESALASRGPDEAWLSWQEHGPRILRWAKGQWSPAPTPARDGAEMVRYPVVDTAPLGDVTLVVSANDKDGISALHIAPVGPKIPGSGSAEPATPH